MTPFSICTEQQLLDRYFFLLDVSTGQAIKSSNVPGLGYVQEIPSVEEAKATMLQIEQELYRINPKKYCKARRITLTVSRSAFDDATDRTNFEGHEH